MNFFSLYIFGSVCMGHIKKCISNFWQLTFCKFLRLNTLHLLKLGYKDQVAGTKSRKKKKSIFVEELAVIYTFFCFQRTDKSNFYEYLHILNATIDGPNYSGAFQLQL